jgi:hypothetical protein
MRDEIANARIAPADGLKEKQQLRRTCDVPCRAVVTDRVKRSINECAMGRSAAGAVRPNEGVDNITSCHPTEEGRMATMSAQGVPAISPPLLPDNDLAGDSRRERFVMRRSQKSCALGEVLAHAWRVTSCHQDWIALRRIGRTKPVHVQTSDGPN